MNYVVPLLVVAVLLFGLCRRVNVYNCFVNGAKQSFSLSLSIFPALAATFLMMNALEASGLDQAVAKFLAPPFELLGVPQEVVKLVLLRPFSGSGSLALLQQVYQTYGADSYIGRCASVVVGSSETVFYVASIYFASTPVRKTGMAIPIALFCNLAGSFLACWLCKVM